MRTVSFLLETYRAINLDVNKSRAERDALAGYRLL